MTLLASAQSDLHWSVAVLVLGAVVGVAGHVIRARGVVLLGIAIVGAACVLFFLSAASNESSTSVAPLHGSGQG